MFNRIRSYSVAQAHTCICVSIKSKIWPKLVPITSIEQSPRPRGLTLCPTSPPHHLVLFQVSAAEELSAFMNSQSQPSDNLPEIAPTLKPEVVVGGEGSSLRNESFVLDEGEDEAADLGLSEASNQASRHASSQAPSQALEGRRRALWVRSGPKEIPAATTTAYVDSVEISAISAELRNHTGPAATADGKTAHSQIGILFLV